MLNSLASADVAAPPPPKKRKAAAASAGGAASDRSKPTTYAQRVAVEQAGGEQASAVKAKKCVDCVLVQPVFAMPEDTRTKWCAGCSKSHPGAVRRVALPKSCEDCRGKRPEFGLPSENKRRWCSICAKNYDGAVDIGNKKCEDCFVRAPSFGVMEEKKRRWCRSCAKNHDDAVSRTKWNKSQTATASTQERSRQTSVSC